MPRSLTSPSALDELAGRIRRMTPDRARQWGTMTPHEMLCHVADSFSAVLGERPLSAMPGGRLKRRLMRLVALHTPLPWPNGVPTMPEVDPRRAGTRPGAFEQDRERLMGLMRRFASPGASYTPHPMFGPLSRAEWMVWGYRHTDHHLRQFGL